VLFSALAFVREYALTEDADVKELKDLRVWFDKYLGTPIDSPMQVIKIPMPFLYRGLKTQQKCIFKRCILQKAIGKV